MERNIMKVQRILKKLKKVNFKLKLIKKLKAERRSLTSFERFQIVLSEVARDMKSLDKDKNIEVIDLCDDDDDDVSSNRDKSVMEEEKNKDNSNNIVSSDDEIKKANEIFLAIKRECPICYDIFSTKDLLFTPCSHFCCLECYIKMTDTSRCHICQSKVPLFIQYKKCGDTLKFQVSSSSSDNAAAAETDDDGGSENYETFRNGIISNSRYRYDDIYENIVGGDGNESVISEPSEHESMGHFYADDTDDYDYHEDRRPSERECINRAWCGWQY